MDWVGTAVRSGAPSGQSASAKLSTDATDYPHALAMVASGVCLADGVAERGSDESFANSPAAPAVRCFFHLDGRYLLNLPAHGRHLAASRGTTRGAAAAQRCSGPARPGAGARPRHGSQVSSCQAARAAPRSCMRSKRRTCVGRPRHPRGPGHKRGVKTSSPLTQTGESADSWWGLAKCIGVSTVRYRAGAFAATPSPAAADWHASA